MLVVACHSRPSKPEDAILSHGFALEKEMLHKVALRSLGIKGWSIDSSGNPIKAHYDKGYQHAVVSISISDYKIIIDTTGSTANGKPYIPERYLKYLLQTMRKNQSFAL